MNLAREYRKSSEDQALSMTYLEQAFNISQKANDFSEVQGSNANNIVMLEYYQELANIMMDEKKTEQAIDCFKKAHQISNIVHGEEHFVTFECLLNLAQVLDQNGAKEEAD